MLKSRLRCLALIGASLACLGWTACDQVSELAVEAKQAVSKPIEDAPPVAKVGSVDLQLDHTVSTKSGYAYLIRLSGRPLVLQFSSSPDGAAESFPSFFLRAEPQHSEPASLVGQQIEAEVYVRENPRGPLWYTTQDRLAKITITSATADSINADLEGLLVNGDTGATTEFTGKLSGSLKLVP